MPVRRKLDGLRIAHLDVGLHVVSAGEGKIFTADLAVMAMLQRGYGVLDALIDAVDNYNMHAAAPLLRLQLDTLFRVSYMANHAEADSLAIRLLNGEEFRSMRDADGKKLTDGRLQELAAAHHDWAIAVYRETSGWVHFSLSHMKATTQTGDDGSIFMGIPLRPTVLPVSLWLEVLGAAVQATDEIFEYVRRWAETKAHSARRIRDANT
ncbi:hypothetical protein A3K89_22110 [Rhodococcoides kyotonense]|uniref:Uncharacterized protein n=2 Tax=Rhodococcoides kyotonense TaxID=398843 RepID=A0A177YE40_9NOCA|nr:hypothetical protein A3K89_22110 [Rhodococcus kyotonensis]